MTKLPAKLPCDTCGRVIERRWAEGLSTASKASPVLKWHVGRDGKECPGKGVAAAS